MKPAERFVTEMRPRWDELVLLSQRLRGRRLRRASAADVERLAALIRQVSGDLATARRDYPGSELPSYLQTLLTTAQPLLYRRSASGLPALLGFFATGLPRRFRQLGPYTAFAGLCLLAGTAAGWAAVALRPDLIGLLPPGFQASVDSHHIGNPLALSGQFSSQLSAFIIQNNIRVAALACVLGLLLGIPTVALLLENGFLLGVLASASHRAGLDLQFWALIVPHGVIELTVICTAAGAGLSLGDAILRPGLDPRGASLIKAARPAVELALGISCLLLVAGLIEGFVTPTSLPPLLKLGVGLGSGILLFCWLLLAGRGRNATGEPGGIGPEGFGSDW
ncbi:MAG: stage II sporulation protein M [Candidatus Dormibacteria bacterium]